MQSPTQRSLIPHDNLVQALASDGADESFHKTDFARGIAAQWALPPFPYLESCRRSPFRRWRLDRAAHIAARGPRETLPASAAWSTPAWGYSVTPKCTTRRRSCDSATKTNRTRKVAVGTVKKSMATVCAR